MHLKLLGWFAQTSLLDIGDDYETVRYYKYGKGDSANSKMIESSILKNGPVQGSQEISNSLRLEGILLRVIKICVLSMQFSHSSWRKPLRIHLIVTSSLIIHSYKIYCVRVENLQSSLQIAIFLGSLIMY